MYKRFNFQELTTIKNNFIPNLSNILKKERCQSLKEFFALIFTMGDEVSYYFRGYPLFTFEKNEAYIRYIDQKEKIEIIVPHGAQPKVQGLLKNFLTKKDKNIQKQTIASILGQEVQR